MKSNLKILSNVLVFAIIAFSWGATAFAQDRVGNGGGGEPIGTDEQPLGTFNCTSSETDGISIKVVPDPVESTAYVSLTTPESVTAHHGTLEVTYEPPACCPPGNQVCCGGDGTNLTPADLIKIVLDDGDLISVEFPRDQLEGKGHFSSRAKTVDLTCVKDAISH